MNTPDNDKQTLAARLTAILQRLNRGESLDPHALALELGVNLRTIQRDLNERLAFLGLEKHNGCYQLESKRLGLLNMQDMARFVTLAGLQGLHPQLTTELITDLLNTRLENVLLIRGHNYEDLSGHEEKFRQLQQAISGHHPIGFRYQKAQGEKQVQGVHPYQLVNHSGIWYLAANDAGKIKSYTLTKISGLLVQPEVFTPDSATIEKLAQEDSIWLNFQKTEVVLKISREVANYFQRRKLLDGQKIDKVLEDGGLIVSCEIAHPNQILPIVRYWLPHLRIISPDGMQGDLEKGLFDYLRLS